MADIQLPFGLKNDILAHISQVQQGLAWGISAPNAGSRWLAEKVPCWFITSLISAATSAPQAVETALHLEAKSTLTDRREIRLPSRWRFVSITVSGAMLISPERTFALDNVQAECRTGDMVPDISLIAARPH